MDTTEIKLARIEQKLDDFIQHHGRQHQDVLERLTRYGDRTNTTLLDHEKRIRDNEAMKGKLTALAGSVSLLLSVFVAYIKEHLFTR